MGEQQHFRALGGQVEDGRRGGADARGVGHLAIAHRQVEVDPDERDLAGHVAKIIQACGTS
jgi:hypothetical protein